MAFRGCGACACALSGACTRDELKESGCLDCRAWPEDLCDEWAVALGGGFLPPAGGAAMAMAALAGGVLVRAPSNRGGEGSIYCEASGA